MRPTTLLTTAMLVALSCQREPEPSADAGPAPTQPRPNQAEDPSKPGPLIVGDLQVVTPAGLQQGDPFTVGKLVWVSRSDIRFNEQSLARIVDGRVAEQHLRGEHLIDPLWEHLVEASDAAKSKAAYDGVEWTEPLVFAADESTPYATIVNLLFTAGRAEWRHFGFVIGPLGSKLFYLPFEVPVFGDDPRERPEGAALLVRHVKPDMLTNRGRQPDVVGELLSVELTAEGLSIGRGDSSRFPPVAYPGEASIAIAEAANAVRAANPDARHVVISAEGDVPLRDVMQVMIAARSPSCKASGEGCVLPNVILISGHAHDFQTPAPNTIDQLDPDREVWGGLPAAEAAGQPAIVRELIGPQTGGAGLRAKLTVELDNKPKVAGGLDADIVRRIVKAHINELRFCYEAGFKQHPDARGRVVLEFAIGSNGKVASAQLGASELPDVIGQCMVKAVKRWTFPKPRGGGVASVVFPVELRPG